MQFSWRSVFEYSLSRLLPAAVALVAISIYTRLFNPAEFGQYNIILSVVSFLVLIGSAQIRPIILRFFAKYKAENRVDQFFINIALLQIALSIVTSIVVLIIKIFLHEYIPPRYIEYIYIIIILFFFSGLFESFIHIFRANNQSKIFSLLWILYSLLRHGSAITFCVLFSPKLEFLFAGFIFSSILLDIILLFILIHRFGSNFHLIDIKILNDKVKFGFPIMIASLSFWFFRYSDRFLIEWIRDSAEVGFYTAGFTIAERGINLALSALMLHAYPLLSSMYEEQDAQSTSTLLSDLSQKYIVLAFPLLIMISLLSKDIVTVYLDDRYLDSSIVLPMLTLSFCLIGLSEYVAKGFELTKKTKSLAYLAILAALLGIALNLFAIRFYGFLGAGFVSIVSSATYLLIMTILVQKHLPWSVSIKFLLKMLIPGSLLILIIMGVNYSIVSSLLRIIIGILFGGIVYISISKSLKIL